MAEKTFHINVVTSNGHFQKKANLKSKHHKISFTEKRDFQNIEDC